MILKKQMNYRSRSRNLFKLGRLRGIEVGLCVLAIATTVKTQAFAYTTINAKTQAAIVEVINDEYRAAAFYSAVIKKFGNVRPFSNVVEAENRHIQLWENLFAKYGLPIP